MGRKLVRTKERKILGVCGGFAEFIGTDATIIRVAVALLTLFTAVVPCVIAYFVCALIIPEDDGIIN